jgi:B12-binding domain/radical SAM domain protein
MSLPYPVAFILTRHNRSSIASLLAVLEAELPAGLIAPTLIGSAREFDGHGLLVCSFTSLQAGEVEEELREARARLGEGLLSMAGGSHASGAPEATLAMGFRWVVRGEAGPVFAGVVRQLAGGELPAGGILQDERFESLDRYPPWPASGQLFSQIEITRGCPMACAFCQTPRLFGRRPRHRSIESLKPLFERSVATGHSFTRFVAPNAFGYGSQDGIHPCRPAVEALIRTARSAGYTEVFLGTFPSEVRPESATEEMLSLVKDLCDNDTIAVGLQSGSDAVLRRLGRGHTVREGLDAIERIARAGFTPKVDFMFGLPDETDAERAESRAAIRRLIEEHGATIHAHIFTPLPGTPLADARTSPIDDETRALIEWLAGQGSATGVRAGHLG